MILGQVSWLDCLVFLIFLAPQLIWRVGFFTTLFCGIRTLPFLLIRLPCGFLYDRLYLSRENRSPFVQQATWFEDVVIRCVRYAFAFIPANIGRVFFSKYVSLPFLRFRMIRHGYFRSPIHWHEVNQDSFKGIWIINDQSREPDVVIYYAHGGGFSMGSSYFYLEFLLAWLGLLKTQGNFQNPAIFALEYTLVPDESYPVQLHETIAGYKYVLSNTSHPSKICVSGDSAGGTLILSLLLHLATISSLGNSKSITNAISGNIGRNQDHQLHKTSMTPGIAILISPWTTLHSPLDKDTSSDYLDADNLHNYALQYAGPKISVHDPLISPGNCRALSWWKKASPSKGFFVMYGAEEVFALEIERLVKLWEEGGVKVRSIEEPGGIHAWPVAGLFLSSTREERQKGLRVIVRQVKEMMGSVRKD